MPIGTKSEEYNIVTKRVPTFYFVGVTTKKSSIMKVFPRWMAVLERPDVVIEGIDHHLHDDTEAYRQTVAQIKYDPLSLGALVTSHKISLYEATKDMFDVLDSSTLSTGEVSCISKRDGRLVGHAKDPLTAGLSLDALLGKLYFQQTGANVLNFGAGGSGKAIALHLLNKDDKGDRPTRFVMVNRSEPRLAQFKDMVNATDTDIQFECVLNDDPKRNDEIMSELPTGSVVINATGLGKDLPGSPITWEGLFPQEGVAWEINYRGELDFWHQAKAQEKIRSLEVEDGWLYFLHGWTQHISEVLKIEINDKIFKELAEIGEEVRPELVYRPQNQINQEEEGEC
jgi:shikimate 5-dehydrogenase